MWPSLNPLRCALVESPAPVRCKYLQFGHKNIHIRITRIMRTSKYSQSDKTHQCGEESPDKTHLWVLSDCEHLLPARQIVATGQEPQVVRKFQIRLTWSDLLVADGLGVGTAGIWGR